MDDERMLQAWKEIGLAIGLYDPRPAWRRRVDRWIAALARPLGLTYPPKPRRRCPPA